MQEAEIPSPTQVVIEAMQDKKGRDIVHADLSGCTGAVCDHMILCTAGSPTQAWALAENVADRLRERLGESPLSVTGRDYAHWVAMDCAGVFVHIFLEEERAYYDLEHLWADARLRRVPNPD